MNIFNILKQDLISVIKNIYPQVTDFSNITVELPKDINLADFASNAAMVLKTQLGEPPIQIAGNIAAELKKQHYIKSAVACAPGFINITVNLQMWAKLLHEVIKLNLNYGDSSLLAHKKINIEFVSTNPTGPLHIGHARGAVVGDTIARLLKKCGADVDKEYYINDAGTQIEMLAKSCMARYKQALGVAFEITEDMYPGDYLIPIGEKLKSDYGATLLDMTEQERNELIKSAAINTMMELIKIELHDLGVDYDIFTSERFDIIAAGYVDKSYDILEKQGYIYNGVLEPPKGMIHKDWEAKEQVIFRATDFGDDADRVVKKSDGNFTYLAGDLGLALHKINRGYKELIMVLGADHIGYVKRIKAVVNALSNNLVNVEIKITQLVNLFKNGQPFKMSKRKGNFVLARDVLNEVGKDIIRFVMLSRKTDTVLDFDFEKVKEQSRDNPVFYVQYAHARACSVLRKAEEMGIKYSLSDELLGNLNNQHEINLIKRIAQFPKIIESSALSYDPHKITFYLIELANEFHAHWSKGNEAEDLRFIIEDNIPLSSARCTLVKAIQTTIQAGLDTLGIIAVSSM